MMLASVPTLAPLAEDWSVSFSSGGPFHATVIVVNALIVIAVCVVGKTLLKQDERDGLNVGSEGREFRLRRMIAWTIIASQTFIFLRRFVYFDIQDSLPLHMCRLGVWIAAWLMWSLDRRARSLTLFWGIGLSAQIFITPFLKHGYGSIAFLIYWINHLQIVGVAIYDIAVLGYRPNKRDLRFASIAGVLFAAVVFGLNIVFSTNYSYLGNGTHEGSSLVDKLGGYPIRALWITVASLIMFAIIFGISKGLGLFRSRILKKPPVREISAVSTR
jgi:hypothetical integral membrane protein (TIGR02206 family)